MFKENKQFWWLFIGVIILFFLLYTVLRSGFTQGSLNFSGFPFSILNPNTSVYKAPTKAADINKTYQAIIKTNLGEFTVDLFIDNAPITVTNFINLSNAGYYNGTTFYKLIPGLLIQGGSSLTKNGNLNDDSFGGPGYIINDEINWDSLDYSDNLKSQLTNEGYTSTTKINSKDLLHYSLAMGGNGPNTGGGQFFIILAQNSDSKLNDLKGRHTVFGVVTGGYKVIEAMSNSEIDYSNKDIPRPVKDIIIDKVTIIIK